MSFIGLRYIFILERFNGGVFMNTCVMCGEIVLDENHVCQYCIDEVNRRHEEKINSDLRLLNLISGGRGDRNSNGS